MTVKEIKKIRAKLKLTQLGFAKALGLSVRTVQSWETDKLAHRTPSEESELKIKALLAKGRQ